MSDDSGVYILQTKGPEYRVILAHAIDNIYGEWDQENRLFRPNVAQIIEYFGTCRVFENLEDAWDMAEHMEVTKGPTEYGPALIREFDGVDFQWMVEEHGKIISGREESSGL